MLGFLTLLLQVASLSAAAPFRTEIDATCIAAARTPALYAARVRYDNERRAPSWQRSSPDAEEEMQRNPHFLEAQFAALRRNANVVAATITQLDVTGDGSTDYEYCYGNGHLIRVRTIIASATDDMVWTSTVYYGAGRVLSKTFNARDLAKGRTHRATRPDMHAPVYASPAALPFWSVMRGFSAIRQ